MPVGFRTGTIWKMLVGSSVYVLFLYLIFTGRFVMSFDKAPMKLSSDPDTIQKVSDPAFSL